MNTKRGEEDPAAVEEGIVGPPDAGGSGARPRTAKVEQADAAC